MALEIGSPLIHEEIEQDRKDALIGMDDWKDVDTFRRYMRGEQAVTLSDKAKELIREVLGNKFCDNVTKQIVAEARDRLIFRGWTCKVKKNQQFLESFYKKSKIKYRQSSIFWDTLGDGNHAVAVNWDKEKKDVRIYRENWWNGRDGVFIGYDDTDEPKYAVKEWVEDKDSIRRNIWFEDRLERWVGNTGGTQWNPIRLQGDKSWPLPWTKTRTKGGPPLHIPYIHFANTGQGYENYGRSELAGGVIGFQDMLNDLQYAMTTAGRLTGYQMLWVSGLVLVKNPETGEVYVPEVGPGNVFMSASNETRFGTFPAGELSQLIDLHSHKLQRVCQMTQTPYHRISGGDWPSGEALLRAEQPAVAKAENQIRRLEVCMTQIAHKAIEIFNVYGTDTKMDESADKAPIEADFMAPERRDPLSKSVIVRNLGDIISNKESLRIMEYSEDEAVQIMEEKQEEARVSLQNMNIAFDRGQGPGTNLPGKGPVAEDAPNEEQDEQTNERSS